MDLNLTTLVVAVLGAGGIGSVLREVFTGVSRLAKGTSLREADRRNDLVKQRDDAEVRATAAEARAEREARNRWAMQEFVAGLRIALISRGLGDLLTGEPPMEQTTAIERANLTPEARTRRQAISDERDRA